jgi:hypothetical protein
LAGRPVRRRAARLGDDEVARLNDLFYLLMVDECGLSPADAARVLGHRITRSGRNIRLRPVRPHATRAGVLALLVREIENARPDAGRA